MLGGLQFSLIILWLALPLTVWLARLMSGKRIHGVFLFGICVFLGYFAFVGTAWTADAMIQQRLDSFDLNGDGDISGDENTPEAQEAMDDWASDTGRTLAIFTGLPITGIWAAFSLTPLCLVEWIVRQLRAKKQDDSPLVEDAVPKPDVPPMPMDIPFHSPNDE